MLLGVDHELDVAIRKKLLEAFSDCAGGICGILDPQNQLKGAGIVLITKGNEIRLKLGLRAAKRLEKREAGSRRDRDGHILSKLSQEGCPKKGVTTGSNGGNCKN